MPPKYKLKTLFELKIRARVRMGMNMGWKSMEISLERNTDMR
jgi:hypothetical protein